jgi:hypothetical protein
MSPRRRSNAAQDTPEQQRRPVWMPALLVIAALAVGITAFVIRDERHTETVTVTKGLAPASTHTGGTAGPAGLRTEKEVTATKVTSDGTFELVLGVAAALLILGAFYARVSKVSFAGNSVEMAAAQAPAVAQEVARGAEQKVREASSDGKLTVEEAMGIARTVAEAAARTQADVTRWNVTGEGGPLASLPLIAGRARRQAAEAPIPDAVLKRLAATALDESDSG